MTYNTPAYTIFAKSMVGTCCRESLLNRVRTKASEFTEELTEAIENVAFLDQTLFEEPQLPPQQQVVDKLADMMYASDMILDMFRDERCRVPPHLVAMEPEVRRIYDDINDLMKRLTD